MYTEMEAPHAKQLVFTDASGSRVLVSLAELEPGRQGFPRAPTCMSLSEPATRPWLLLYGARA